MKNRVIIKREYCLAFIELCMFAMLSFVLRTIGFADKEPEVMGAIWTVFCTIFFWRICKCVKMESWFFRLVTVTYLGRIVIVFLNNVLNHRLFWTGDSGLLFFRAEEFYYGDYSVDQVLGSTAYEYILNILFHIYGLNRYITELMQTLLICSASIIIYHFGKSFRVNSHSIRVISIFFLYTPIQWMYTMVAMREAWYIFLGAIVFACYAKWLEDRKNFFIVGAFIFSILATLMHRGNAAWIVALLIAVILTDSKSKQCILERIRGWQFLALFMALIGITVLMTEFRSVAEMATQVINRAQYVGYIIAPGNSDYLFYKEYKNILEILFWSPIRMAFYLISPLPWDWRGIKDVMAFLMDSCFHIATLFLMLKFNTKRRGDASDRSLVWFGFFLYVIVTLVYGWGTKNAGTAMRHRLNMYSIECMLFLLCSKKELINQRGKRFLAYNIRE